MEGHTVIGWRLFKNYDSGDFTWEFSSKGICLEYIQGRHIFKTLYSYFPKDHILLINRTKYKFDLYMASACIASSYFVEPINENECWM